MFGLLDSGGPELRVPDIRQGIRIGRMRARANWTRFRLAVTPTPHPLDERAAVERLPDDPTILFLCLGNICRSPLAERYLRNRLDERGLDQFTVDSAGFIETEGRSSPDSAVETAPEFGVSLADHASTRVTRSMLRDSDVVFVMDAQNYVRLKRQYGDLVDHAWFLKSFSDADDYEITDPYDADVEEFRRVYAEITDAVDAFVDQVESR